MNLDPVAVYVHTPFCPSKCGYCDFNSFALDGEIIERTVAATVSEIERSYWRGRPAKTIFFGGGTPTFLSAEQLCRLLRTVIEAHPPVAGAEITSEANPGTVDAEKFSAMRAAGFNRLSLGAQSFQSGELIQLGRVHEASDIARAVQAARQAGFDNLNLDLMFALPGQSPRTWEQNLKTALALRPDHLSLYCLTIEPNTRFHRYAQRGLLDLPDDESQVQMYDSACSLAEKAGFRQYEISNFCRPGFECEHNLCYWHEEEYLGYGPGAVGCFASSDDGRTRYTNQKHPERYCDALEGAIDMWCDSEVLDADTLAFERWMLGIRLNEGVPVEGLSLDHSALEKFLDTGWIEERDGSVFLTAEGRHFCTEITVAAWRELALRP
ncbi:MAG: radical SAM family heme chaperone HemW [Armatimonadetes bacterium]|nr:radical SAM family heme chaperone HemW [Armatimonadota bacterium]